MQDGQSVDYVDQLLADISQLEDRVEELETALARVDDLEARVDDVDRRTDMLELVNETDNMDAKQRSITLLQHLHAKAESRRKRGQQPAATLTRDQAEDALHYPDLHRTTFFDDMERCARLVDDEAVCNYADGELMLDLTNGDLDAAHKSTGGE